MAITLEALIYNREASLGKRQRENPSPRTAAKLEELRYLKNRWRLLNNQPTPTPCQK
jgi:hypothetical protein